MVFAGVSGSGKSTLAAAAALNGWGYIADEVAVMQAGRIVEHGACADVLGEPRHDYTRRLMAAVRPPPDGGAHEQPARDWIPKRSLSNAVTNLWCR